LSLASAGPISRGLVHYQAQSQLGLASSRPRVIRKFSIIILESLYTQFLLGPSNNSTSKAPTTNLDRYLDGLKDRPCISPLTGYYMHPGKKNKFIKFKEIITSEKKNDWEPTYHKVLSSVINELLHLFLAVITLYMRFNKKVHRAWLVSKNRSLQ
jgi:hypothetical protein